MKRILLFLVCVLQWGCIFAQTNFYPLSITIDKGGYLVCKIPCYSRMQDKVYRSDYSGYTVNIPKKGFEWELWTSNIMSLHTFLYESKQGILIRIIPEDKSADDIKYLKPPFVERDSTYAPSLEDVKRLYDIIDAEYIFERLVASGDYPQWEKIGSGLKAMEKNISKKNKKRKNLIIERKGVLILLFNIKEKNFNEYKELVQSFTFVECE